MKRSFCKKPVVFIDTNFWLLPYVNRIDILSELKDLLFDFDIILSKGVVNELESIRKSADKGREKVAAKVGLGLIEKEGAKILPDEGPVDSFITGLPGKYEDLIVCTNDKDLRKKLRKKGGVRIIGMKGKKRRIGFILP